MHPRKVQAREIDEGVVARENDLFCADPPLFCFDLVVLDPDNRGVLVNGQRLRHVFEKPQRVKLRLTGKADRPGGGKGQRRLPHEGGGQPQ